MAKAKKKGLLYGLLFFLLLLFLCPSMNMKAVSAAGSSTWYKKVLNSKKGSYKVRYQTDHKAKTKRVYRKSFTHYKVLDINKDGVKELLLLKKPAGGQDNIYQVLLLTYHKKKVKPLLCFAMNGGRGGIIMRNGLLVLHNSGSDFYYTMQVTVKNGKLKKVRDFRYQKDAPNKPYVYWYFYNGKRVSVKKITQLMDKYYGKYPRKVITNAGFNKIKTASSGKKAKTSGASVKLNKTKATIYVTGTKSVQLKATVKGKSKKITWSSSNKKIATVSAKGKVTAKKTGSVTIKAKANGKIAKCKITVKAKQKKYSQKTVEKKVKAYVKKHFYKSYACEPHVWKGKYAFLVRCYAEYVTQANVLIGEVYVNPYTCVATYIPEYGPKQTWKLK